MNRVSILFAGLLGGLALAPMRASAEVALPPEMVKAAQPITAEEEMAIGREVAANVIAQFGLYEDEALTEYVNLVGLAVSEAAPRRDVPYRFAILNADHLNALAAPGGYIFITKGLLFRLQDEAQLASVLAHEVAHVSRRHVVQAIQKSRIAQAAIPGYAKAAAQKAQWMKEISDLAVQMVWKGLSREDELEADRFGVQYASETGYDARSFREVLEMLKARSHVQEAKDVRFLLSTHPKPEDRIQQVQQKIDALPPGGARMEERFKKAVKV